MTVSRVAAVAVGALALVIPATAKAGTVTGSVASITYAGAAGGGENVTIQPTAGLIAFESPAG